MLNIIADLKKDGKEYIGTNSFQSMTEAKWHYEVWGYEVVKLYTTEEAHLCKYCGNIAEGSYEDVLCPDCRAMFGHAFYSEL